MIFEVAIVGSKKAAVNKLKTMLTAYLNDYTKRLTILL